MGGVQEVLQYQLFTISGTPVNVMTLAMAGFIALLTLIFSAVAEKATIRFLRARGVTDEGSMGATGATIWSWHVDSRRFGGPVLADGLIYMNSSGDNPEQMVHVLDAGSGAELWSLADVADPTVAGDLLFVNSWDSNELQARDRLSGDLLWSGDTDGARLSGQCVADGFVYVHSVSGYLYAFEATATPGGSRTPAWYGATQPLGGGIL